MLREKPNRQPREGESTDAEHRGGALRISDEGAVMALERRERIVQRNELVNHTGRNQLRRAKPFEVSRHAVMNAWYSVKSNHGAHGIDGQSIAEFEEDLKNNLYKLWNRLSSGSYFPPAVRAVEIPKSNGKKRLLGIPTVADRVAQTVIRNRFEQLVDPYFHKDSYAYRSGKSALDAIETTRKRCWQYDWVLEFDIKSAFDNIDHELMLKAVCHHTTCRWTRLYIKRWLKAPLERDGKVETRDKGTPQGGVVSPLLFNLYLHYAFDSWMERNYPLVPFARYADDGLLHCRTEHEAVYLRKVIGQRLKSCGLELHPEKTKIVYCRDANRKGRYPNTQFGFLGYTFRGRLAKSKHGRYFNSFSPAISNASAKRVRQQMSSWTLARWTNANLQDIAEKVNASLRGWWNFYGAFYPSVFKRVLAHLNIILVKWVVRKYRRFKGSRLKAVKWLRGIAEREPGILFHWQLGIKPAVEQ
jgi:group II intron reverse transcriptase/maturase